MLSVQPELCQAEQDFDYEASWHIQNGTSLYELQKLGGWSSLDMVNRYAHLNSDYLKKAAEHLVTGTNLVHEQNTMILGAS